MLTATLERIKSRREEHIANPVAVIDRTNKVNLLRKFHARRAGVLAVALLAVNQLSDNGLVGIAGAADRGAEWVLEGSNGTEHEGLVAGSLHSVGNFLSENVRMPHFDKATDKQVVVTPQPEATLPECPTTATQVDLNGRYVSTAVYDLNADFLPTLGNNKLAFDPLWINHFEADNNGMNPNQPTASTVVLRQLVSVANCEIR